MRNAFNELLTILATFDSLFLIFNGFGSILVLNNRSDWISQNVADVAIVLAKVFMCASILMLVALTWERHFAICSPHQYRIHVRTTPRWRHLCRYYIPVMLCSILFNIPTFINIERSWLENNPLYRKINLYYRIFHPL